MRGAAFQPVTPSNIQAYAGRTLDFLQIIEKTIDGLKEDCDILTSINTGIETKIEQLKAAPPDVMLDPDGRVCKLLGQCGDVVARLHATNTRRHQSACDDKRLTEDDGVVEAYEELLQRLSHFHDALEELNEWIATHDALLEPSVGPTYDTADELFKAILEKS